MKVVLAGPMATAAFRDALGLKLDGAPAGVIQTPINTLGAELVRRGREVTAICLDPSLSAPVRVREGPLSLIYLPQRVRARERVSDLFAWEVDAIRRELQQIKPDVVHAHWTYEYAEAAVSSGSPHVVTMHDVPLEIAFLFHNVYRTLRAYMALRLMARVRQLAVVSPRMSTWARLHGYRGPMAVVPNGVEAPAPARPARARLSAPLRIATVGDVTARKNIVGAIEAFFHLRADFPEAELHLFGGGLDAAFTRGAPGVIGHGATPHAILMRFLADEATVLLHPSLQETFGVIVAEAMARGVPALAGRRAGGVTFVLGPNAEARLTDVRRPKEMARAVAALIGDPVGYTAASDDGRERVQALFSMAGMTDAYEALYARVIGKSHP